MNSNSEHLLHKKQAALAQAKTIVITLEAQIGDLLALIDLERKTLAMGESPLEAFLRGNTVVSGQLFSPEAASMDNASSLLSATPTCAPASQPRNTKNAVSRKVVELLEESSVPLTVAEIYSVLNERLENLSTRGSVRGTLFALAKSKKIVAHGQGRYSKNGIPIATNDESPASTGLSGATMSLAG